MAQVLANSTVRLSVTCNNGQSSCVDFCVGACPSPPTPPAPKSCADNNWEGIPQWVNAQCRGEAGSKDCWDSWCEANCDPFGQLHPACALSMSEATGDDRCYCASHPEQQHCVHSVSADAHKCYQACANEDFAEPDMEDRGRCPIPYTAVDQVQHILQCDDGSTNVKDCVTSHHQVVNVTHTRMGIVMLLGTGIITGYQATGFSQTGAAGVWNSVLAQMLSVPESAVSSQLQDHVQDTLAAEDDDATISLQFSVGLSSQESGHQSKEMVTNEDFNSQFVKAFRAIVSTAPDAFATRIVNSSLYQSAAPSGGHHKSHTAAIVLGVLGGLLGAGIIVAGAVVWYRRHSASSGNRAEDDSSLLADESLTNEEPHLPEVPSTHPPSDSSGLV